MLVAASWPILLLSVLSDFGVLLHFLTPSDGLSALVKTTLQLNLITGAMIWTTLAWLWILAIFSVQESRTLRLFGLLFGVLLPNLLDLVHYLAVQSHSGAYVLFIGSSSGETPQFATIVSMALLATTLLSYPWGHRLFGNICAFSIYCAMLLSGIDYEVTLPGADRDYALPNGAGSVVIGISALDDAMAWQPLYCREASEDVWPQTAEWEAEAEITLPFFVSTTPVPRTVLYLAPLFNVMWFALVLRLQLWLLSVSPARQRELSH